ncbi:hypothetical protein Ocin01_17879 [Orchesella cincta]|uniref:C-type lectin domain-containing protein n=1 Tax=Orchesella cincta TaxID=48709 RepID=A0A1D2M758_ORCCI|nr:hypothetical protein Ocin01_17879 [Orchesella cincta]
MLKVNIMLRIFAVQIIIICSTDAELVLIGEYPEVNDQIKTYYSDSSRRNYSDSKEFCAKVGSGYTIATVETDTALKVLKENRGKFSGTHWIGLKLGNLPGILVWDEETDTVSQLNVEWKPVENRLSICGAYYSNETQYFRSLLCSLNYQVICEHLRPKPTP